MSTLGGSTINASPTVNAVVHGDDVEMRDVSQNHEESDMDAEGEPEEGDEEAAGRGDLRQLISDVSTYLCEVEEK